ncbi:hypothetical protein THRCLA_20009 [Thraustotheca clavata]|uniref:Uncharacterized protein n=1 Tax=Thraustotheca clavata TaxID=74557 RepID=A0A1W0ADA1_9STRA|nr:hypothetical protein THRCLA_20009 [Thraustotheca clavata]
MEFATRATVQELCNDGCRMMHFVCHVTATELILEDGAGGATKLSPNEMTSILSHSTVELAQVTSYAKNSNGHLFFLQCGIPHVIALSPSSKTNFDTTMAFTKLLHVALVSGRSIQDAFDMAQNCISFLGHAIQFILYPEDADHNVVLFPRTNSPSTSAITAIESPPQILGGVSKYFEGRIEEAQIVCKTLMNRRRPRWFSVLGPARCGKSQFTSAVAQYISQRKVFDGGIIHINVPLELKYRPEADVRSSILEAFTTLDHEMGKWQHVLVICDGYERLKLKSSLVKKLEVLLAKHQNISFLATGITIMDVPQMPHKTDQIILSPLNLQESDRGIEHDTEVEATLSVHRVDYNNMIPPTFWDGTARIPTPRTSTLTSKPSCALM